MTFLSSMPEIRHVAVSRDIKRGIRVNIEWDRQGLTAGIIIDTSREAKCSP